MGRLESAATGGVIYAFNVQGHTLLSVLAFLGTGLLGLAAAAAGGALWLTGRRKLAGRVLAGAAVVLGLYGAALLVFAASSREQVLRAGEEKYFCEVDCHLTYSVREVQRAKTLGPPGAGQTRADGLFYVVTLRTRFDPETVSSRRPQDLTLTPNSRRLVVTDARGRRFQPSREGQAAIAAAGAESAPLTQALLPGESYQTLIVFDLPEDVVGPRLVLTEDFWATRFLIGHENSFGHRKASFGL